MNPALRLQLVSILAVMLLLGLPSLEAAAQDSLIVQISAVRTDSFPDMVMYASVSDQDGNRLTGLTPQNFTILEDENELPATSVQEERIGTRQIFVLNTSLALGLRDASGKTRYDYARQALYGWWQLPDAAQVGLDDLSLYTSEAVLAEHQSAAALLASRLAGFTPAFELETDPYRRIQQALLQAHTPLPREGMTSSLIFLTPIVRGPELDAINDTIVAAQELGVRIYTVLLADAADMENPIVTEMSRLSTETGGELMLLEPESGLNDLARKVISQQSQYILHYTSQADTSGSHSLALVAGNAAASGASSPNTFSIDILPPSIAFQALPARIVRQTEDPAQPLEEIRPTELEVLIDIDFPDGYPRKLSRTVLYINEEQVLVNTSEPFERFTWDISSYTASGSLALSAEVVDSLGLSSTTSSHSLELEISLPPSGLAALQPLLNNLLLTLSGILLAAGVVTGVVFFIRRSITSARIPVETDPANRRAQPARQLRSNAGQGSELPEAVLVSEENPEQSVDLFGIDHIIGRDPSLATILLPDPSVDPLHARMIRHANGAYLLKDLGSSAGTWVNYHQIPESGMILNHGDLVNIGRTAFRFVWSSPPDSSPPKVTVLETTERDGEHS